MGAELGQLAPTVQGDIPYHMVSSSVLKLRESCLETSAQDLMGHQLVGGEPLCCALLVLMILILLSLLFSLDFLPY